MQCSGDKAGGFVHSDVIGSARLQVQVLLLTLLIGGVLNGFSFF